MTPGYVYVLRAENGLIKIGRSTNPKIRLEAYAGYPVEVHLLHEISTNDMVGLEAHLHRKHAMTRVRGEWFRLDDAELLALCRTEEWGAPPDGFPESRKATLYVHVDAALKARFARLAEKRGVPLCVLLEMVLRDYLEREEPKEGLSAQGMEE